MSACCTAHVFELEIINSCKQTTRRIDLYNINTQYFEINSIKNSSFKKMTSFKENKSDMDIDIDVIDIINNNYLESESDSFEQHSESDNERFYSQSSTGKFSKARKKSNRKKNANSMADNREQSKYYLRSKCPHGCCQTNKNQLLKHHYIDHQQKNRK